MRERDGCVPTWQRLLAPTVSEQLPGLPSGACWRNRRRAPRAHCGADRRCASAARRTRSVLWCCWVFWVLRERRDWRRLYSSRKFADEARPRYFAKYSATSAATTVQSLLVKLGLQSVKSTVKSTVPRQLLKRSIQQPQRLLATVKVGLQGLRSTTAGTAVSKSADVPPEVTKHGTTTESELAELPGELHDEAGRSWSRAHGTTSAPLSAVARKWRKNRKKKPPESNFFGNRVEADPEFCALMSRLKEVFSEESHESPRSQPNVRRATPTSYWAPKEKVRERE